MASTVYTHNQTCQRMLTWLFSVDWSGLAWLCSSAPIYTTLLFMINHHWKTQSIYVSGRDPYLYRIYTLRLYPFEAGIILKSTCSLK